MAPVAEDITILRPDRARIGPHRLRVFAGPMWVRPDGETWRPIEEVVSVSIEGPGWRVRVGSEWAHVFPITPIAAAIRRRVNHGRHFGDVLDSALAPDEVRFRVQTSGPPFAAGRAVLATYDGVALGLLLDDWLARFAAVLEGDGIVLDLRAAKARGPEINLDPTIEATAQSGSLDVYSFTSWPDCRSGGQGMTVYANNLVQAKAAKPGPWTMSRGFVQFDTSGIGTVTAASLYLNLGNLPANGNVANIGTIADYATLDVTDWDGADPTITRHVETRDYSGDQIGSWHEVVLEVGDIVTDGNTCFMAREDDHDVDNVDPGGGFYFGVSWYGPNEEGSEPYLDITVGQTHNLAGTITAAAALSGALSFAGTAAAAAELVGALTLTKNLAGTISAASAAAGYLTAGDTGGYNWYMGAGGLSAIDYGTIVTFQPAGTTSVILAGLGLLAETDYYFAVRCVSAAGVEETNMTRHVHVLLDDAGNLISARPNRPSIARAEAAAAGKIDLTFIYSAAGERGVATGIQVAEMVGGAIDWGSLLETISISGDTIRTVELAETFDDGETVRLAIRAVTAAGITGPPRLAQSVVADSSGPPALNYITASQET